MKFFRIQGERKCKKKYLACDATSIYSYSGTLRQVKYGKNKDRDHLSQIDLATLLVEESNLPFHYMELAWNLPDIKTISELICEIYAL